MIVGWGKLISVLNAWSSCARCKVHFCFRCGTKLRAEQPYKHFEQPGSCYNKLFDYDPVAWVSAPE